MKWVFRAVRDYLLPIALGGLIGGLLVGAFFVWPAVYGARWWEVFAALGTVGAVISAVFINIYQQRNKRKILIKQSQIKTIPLIAILRVLSEKLKKCNEEAKFTCFLCPNSRAQLGSKILSVWEHSNIHENTLLAFSEIDRDSALYLTQQLAWLTSQRRRIGNPTKSSSSNGACWVADFYCVTSENSEKKVVADKLFQFEARINKIIEEADWYCCSS